MELKSPAFEDGGQMPSRYGKSTENISPPLIFQNVPGQAQSLVLVMDDPDSKPVSGKVWDHWVVWNIDPTTVEFPEGEVPSGKEGLNGFDDIGWGGPNPPDDVHEYRFILYALDTVLNFPEQSDKQDVYQQIKGHVIEKAELHGKYKPVFS
jgi:Raf kinase inhibitor-like YbhB/YbcL family protein